MFAASIIARLGLDTRGFKAGLADAGAAAGSQGASIGANFVRGLGSAFTVGAIASFGKTIFNHFANIADEAERLGVSAEAVQMFNQAAEQGGASAAEMAKGLQKLMVSQAQAVAGNDSLRAAFDRNGVSVEDLRKLAPDELMMRLAKSGLGAADAVKLLGRNGTALLPTLRGIADGSIEIGRVLDSELVAKIDKIDDKLKALGQTAYVTFAEKFLAQVKSTEKEAALLKNLWGDLRGIFGGDIGIDHVAALEDEKQITEEKAKQVQLTREGAAASAEAAEAAEAAAKQQERVSFSLAELAADTGQASPGQTNEQWEARTRAGMAARDVLAWEAQAGSQRANFDFEGAKQSMSRADEIRASIAGLKESERGAPQLNAIAENTARTAENTARGIVNR